MKKILAILLLAISSSVWSQQLMTSSLYDLQGNLHNPAVAGVTKQTTMGASYRSMWSGIAGSPVTALVYGSTFLEKANIGVGAYLYSDVTGPTSRRGIQTSYAYHIPTNNGGTFSVGLEARFQQFAIDKAMLIDALGWKVDANTTVTPNFLVIYLPNAPTELQAGARVEHREVFWWGLSLRARQSWMLSAGVKVQKKLMLGYSFDIYSSPLSVFDKGPNAHEVVLRYQFLK